MKNRALTLTIIAFLLGVVTVNLVCSQDITVSNVENLDVGRLKVLEITADKDGVPADSILIDMQGEVDSQLFENNSKLALVPVKAGRIRVKVVAIWFELRIATQTTKELTAVSTADQEPPVSPVPDNGLAGVSEAVSKAARALNDSDTAQALSEAYSGLSGALKAKSSYKQSYFGNDYEYKLQNGYKSEINLAISRTISKRKAESQIADSADWESFFLLVKQQSETFNLEDKSIMSSFLEAVSEGLKI
jgi:hypothetical protein